LARHLQKDKKAGVLLRKKERVKLREAKRQGEREELQERNSECAAPFIKATLN
jgi:hypothetical protein